MANEIRIVVSGTDKGAKEQIAGVGAAAKKASEDAKGLGEKARQAGEDTKTFGDKARKAGEDAKGAGDKSRKAGEDAKGLGDSFKRIGEVAAGVLTADLVQSIGARASQMLGDVGRAASGLEQAVGGTEAVFGSASGAIEEFAQTSSQSVGLSEREFREATTLIGGQLKRMTGDIGFASDASIKLTEIGADLAATYGGTTKEAVDAFSAALRGEADPAERFNLNLQVSAIQAKAVELGLAASTTEVNDAAKAQATLALIMEQSSDAQGQFARESDSAAGAQQRATAAIEDAQAKMGQALLPIMSKVAGTAADMASGFAAMSGPTQVAAGAVAALSAGLLLLGPRIAAARAALIAFGVSARTATLSLGGIGVALVAAATVLAAFGRETDDASGSASEFAATLDQATGKITDHTRALALQKLEQSGAAAAAQRLGIDLADLIDAALGNEDAARRIRDRWAEVSDGMAFGSQKSRELTNDFVLVRDSVGATSDALLQSQEAHERAQEAGIETGQVMQETGEKIAELPPMLEGLSEAYDLAAEDAEEAAFDILSAWQDAAGGFVSSVEAFQEAGEDLVEGQKVTKGKFIKLLEDQVKAQQNWADNMIELAGRVPPSVINELARLGPEGAEQVQLLTTMSDKELRRYVDLMGARGRTAGGQLISETLANFTSGAPALAAIAEQQGSRVAQRIAAGMRRNGTTVEQEARALGFRIDVGLGGDRTIHVTPIITAPIGRLPGNIFTPGALAHGGISGAAGGGPRGRWTLVGEQGPELVNLAPGSDVRPAGETRQMLAEQAQAEDLLSGMRRAGPRGSALYDVWRESDRTLRRARELYDVWSETAEAWRTLNRRTDDTADEVERLGRVVARQADDLERSLTGLAGQAPARGNSRARDMVRAAQQALAAVRGGKTFFEDFSYRGMSDLGDEFNEALGEGFNRSGRQWTRRGVERYLQDVIRQGQQQMAGATGGGVMEMRYVPSGDDLIDLIMRQMRITIRGQYGGDVDVALGGA